MIIATDISVCSNAVLQLGKSAISSFDQGGDIAALCKSIYPQERRTLLREFAWNCVTDRTILAPMATKPAFRYSAQFAPPADFLRLIGVGGYQIGDPNCIDFKLEKGKILASGTALPIEYVFDNENVETWDSKLVELLSARMLWKLAYPLTQSTSLRDTLANEYKEMAKVARSIDSQENPSQELSDDFTLISGRQ